jgi:hypothetical protein
MVKDQNSSNPKKLVTSVHRHHDYSFQDIIILYITAAVNTSVSQASVSQSVGRVPLMFLGGWLGRISHSR